MKFETYQADKRSPGYHHQQPTIHVDHASKPSATAVIEVTADASIVTRAHDRQ